MTRLIGITILTMASAVALLAAQGTPRPAKKDDAPAAKGDAKADPAKADPAKADPAKKDDLPAAPSGEKPEEIIKRLNENFEKSEDKLAKADPREETQKVQDQIVKDLDELIKQQQNNPNC